jgi:hypothetical protein
MLGWCVTLLARFFVDWQRWHVGCGLWKVSGLGYGGQQWKCLGRGHRISPSKGTRPHRLSIIHHCRLSGRQLNWAFPRVVSERTNLQLLFEPRMYVLYLGNSTTEMAVRAHCNRPVSRCNFVNHRSATSGDSHRASQLRPTTANPYFQTGHLLGSSGPVPCVVAGNHLGLLRLHRLHGNMDLASRTLTSWIAFASRDDYTP